MAFDVSAIIATAANEMGENFILVVQSDVDTEDGKCIGCWRLYLLEREACASLFGVKVVFYVMLLHSIIRYGLTGSKFSALR